MEITLESIKFNHDPTFEATGAFHIRRNETNAVVFPEWEIDRCTTPDCSPVAYAINRLPKTKRIMILASFSGKDVPPEGVYIKAVEDRDSSEAPRPLNVLGSSDEPLVRFVSEKAIDIPFTFAADGILKSGASASDLKWRWQFSTDQKEEGTEFQTTEHRIYTVPVMPSCPWEPLSCVSSNIQVPWTEALEYACHWAAGVTTDLDLAATMVTRRVFSLGKSFLSWQEAPNYARTKFDLTKFLALFRDGVGNGQTLNCDDCAAIVSTFANLLGAELSQSSMGRDIFTNPVLLIGDSHWRRMGFDHHSVAWKGKCTENDEVFDACLLIDGDRKPDRPPQFPKNPTAIRFGDRSPGSYQSALSADECFPTPNDPLDGRQRRKFGRGFFADRAFESSSSDFDRFRDRYRFDKWPSSAPSSKTTTAAHGQQFCEQQLVSDYWKSHITETLHADKLANVCHTMLKKDGAFPNQLVDLNVYECADGIDANEILLRVLSCFEAFLERLADKSFGELAFTGGRACIVFRHERLIAVVRSVGRERVNVVPVATLLYDFLQLSDE